VAEVLHTTHLAAQALVVQEVVALVQKEITQMLQQELQELAVAVVVVQVLEETIDLDKAAVLELSSLDTQFNVKLR
jgi:ribosome-binding factor A